VDNREALNRLVQSYKRLFNSDDGKIVLADLQRFCGYNHTSVCEQSPDALQTFFAEGKRRVFLRIWSMINKETKDDRKR